MTNKNIKLTALIIFLAISFSFQDDFFEIAKQIEIYNNVFKTLNINYIDNINPGELTNKAINNTLSNLDPYTRFYNEQQMEDVRIKREGEYAGIGISSWYTQQGIIVANIKKGYPADKAGIKTGDVIVKVNNQDLKIMDREQLSQVLKGAPNTAVALKIIRNKSTLNFDLKLDKIKVNPVPYYKMINKETGYIKLNRFVNKKATDQVRNAFIKLEEKGMKQLVFDLRSNPGGSLLDAINITNLFIEKGKKVVTTRGKIKRNTRVYKTKNLPLNKEIPVVILIDDRSASASEIVSGALQDYDRAVIIGERSFGKGLVQRYFQLNYGTQMKATISKYYTPSGRCIQELDYANRDPQTGKVPKFSDKAVNKFTTENGRTVYDGGGVTPDIDMKFSKKNNETKSLLKSRAIFNFVTEFVRKKPSVSIDNFTFNDNDFDTFKSYLILKDTSFVTKQEYLFKKAYKSVENANYLNSSYNNILKKLKEKKVKKINENKDRIQKKISDEILKRYFYEEGMYDYHLKNDQTIKKAISILNNKNQYNKILKR